MLRADRVRGRRASDRRERFLLYLEGPGDRGILEAWCRRLLPACAGHLSDCSVILGGRRPARALDHFRSVGGSEAGTRALCVLDRDDGSAPQASSPEPGLEFFTWGRRHIESYLLVPGAILRGLRLHESDGRMLRLVREHLPPAGDEDAYRELDAKRVLAPSGSLARALGGPIPLARVARATREAELHPDVHAFFARLRTALGVEAATVVR
jgi:hypothetical protein